MGFFWDAVGDFFTGVGSALSEGLSTVLEGVSGLAREIGNGIKSLCDKIGSEELALIGCIAIAILIPGFGLPEILTLIQIVAEVAKILGVNSGEDSSEELGMKTEVADKKPEDFESTEAYIKYLNDEVKLEDGALENLSEIDKAKYGAMGAALNIKAIEEKYDVSLSPDFLRDVTIMKLSSEEIAQFIDTFKEKDITKMQEMTDYLREKPIEEERGKVSDSMIEALSQLYPECSENEIEEKLVEMKDVLNNY